MTGGAIPDSFGESIGTVSRYSQWTWLESLDNLNTARQNHACGWFTNSDNKRVRVSKLIDSETFSKILLNKLDMCLSVS